MWNLGFVSKDLEQVINLKIKNKGKVSTKVEIIQDNLPI